MANVLFIEPELRTDKLGFLYLSAVLKAAGHSVDLVQDFGGGEAEDALFKMKPDFVMYSVTTGDHGWYLTKNKQLRAKFPFISVMGGPHFTFFSEDGLNDPAIDYVVQGPAEKVIAGLVESPPGEKLVRGVVPEDVNALPPPDRSILYKYPKFGKARMKRFIAGRDCQYACTYCFNHLYHRLFKDQKARFYQITSVDRIIAEIKAVRDEYGLELVYFNDDDLARDHNWLTEFCKKFKQEVNLQFCGSVRASSLRRHLVRMMAYCGCTFMNVALESSVPETQRLLRRGPVTNAHVANAVDWFKQYGIKVRLQNMVGLPVDDPLDDALRTLEFNAMLAPTDSWCSVFQPFPKTDAWKLSLERGFITDRTDCRTFTDDTVLALPDREKINRLAKWWYFAAKWKLPRSTVEELISIPLTPQQKQLIQEHRWREAAQILYEM